jgi:hypothetical protein
MKDSELHKTQYFFRLPIKCENLVFSPFSKVDENTGNPDASAFDFVFSFETGTEK